MEQGSEVIMFANHESDGSVWRLTLRESCTENQAAFELAMLSYRIPVNKVKEISKWFTHLDTHALPHRHTQTNIHMHARIHTHTRIFSA